MEDYVPQEDFVDEDLMERVKKAEKESKPTPKEKSKASRNLPKPTKSKSKIKVEKLKIPRYEDASKEQ